MAKRIALFICIFLNACYSYCQVDSMNRTIPDSISTSKFDSLDALLADTLKPASGFHQQDLYDWVAQLRKKQPRPAKNSFLLIVPYISSNPTAGLMFGLGLTYTYKKDKTDPYFSVITGSASYSTNKLFSSTLKSNLYLSHGKINLNGDWRFLINNETTYGLGTDKFIKTGTEINGVPVKEDSVGQVLKYNQLRFYETVSFKLVGHLFAGFGFHYNRYYQITDSRIDIGDTTISIHYQYSKENGFNPSQYNTVGMSLNILFDSRDNQVNAYRGYYFNVNYRINRTAIGSTQNSTMLLTEYSSFHPLDGIKQRHILGFWFYGNFITSGISPYLALPAIGYDQRQRTGRGYKFGQFRGDDLMYGETEYRFPISARTGILGGDIFLNATTTSNKKGDVKLFDYTRLGYGGGLRIMLDKQSRTRLAIDIGVSPGSVGFYFGAQETF